MSRVIVEGRRAVERDPVVELRAQWARLRSRARDGPPDRPDRTGLAPGSIYEAVTRQMVQGLVEDVQEIKGRLNGLLFMVAGAIVLDLAIRLGAGQG